METQWKTDINQGEFEGALDKLRQAYSKVSLDLQEKEASRILILTGYIHGFSDAQPGRIPKQILRECDKERKWAMKQLEKQYKVFKKTQESVEAE
jgi:hypothetical protein